MENLQICTHQAFLEHLTVHIKLLIDYSSASRIKTIYASGTIVPTPVIQAARLNLAIHLCLATPFASAQAPNPCVTVSHAEVSTTKEHICLVRSSHLDLYLALRVSPRITLPQVVREMSSSTTYTVAKSSLLGCGHGTTRLRSRCHLDS